jgi:heme-degrading monooxygenase HmoA
MNPIAPVVGINIYSVPKGQEEQFIRWWYDMRERLIRGRGFVAGNLHRNLDDNAPFNFINVAEWENELYSTLYKQSAAQMKAEMREQGVDMTPGLFAVVSNY